MPRPKFDELINPRDITRATRRDIVDFLVVSEHRFHGRMELVDFLKRIWDLASMGSTDSRFATAEGDIRQHMVRNQDWDDSYLLNDYLELSDADDGLFLEFLENCVHPAVQRDEDVQAELVAELNELLARDGYKLAATGTLAQRPVYKAQKSNGGVVGTSGSPTYEVVLSFAGEDRKYVEGVATYLQAHGVKVFYDKFEEVHLWGKDLVEYLDEIYGGNSRYCVMFISKHYATKDWTIHERRSALAKALKTRSEYILPARFDDAEIPGIRPSVGYINLAGRTPQEFGTLILKKLGKVV